MQQEINPRTNRPYTSLYYEIKRERECLPVYQYKQQIIDTIKNNKVTIIEGQTGSGKTTQIPQFLLEANLAGDLQILCTQPRRVAAINVSRRVSQELDEEVGETVGYRVRFRSKLSQSTKLVYMTDGLLMRDFVEDPKVSRYSIIIIDEAHERTINTDIIIGLLRQLIEFRDDLHIVIMSATLEATKFIEFFSGAPHLEIPGRTFPVEIIYLDEAVGSYTDTAISRVVTIHQTEKPGDILLFMTGEEEIELSCSRIRDLISSHQARADSSIMKALVLPLYASLPQEEQMKVFEKTPENTRKIIVSTNIAETSVTIDGVVYVVDPGYVKQNQYDPDRHMTRLVITPISQAAANQRAGRAGRTRPGKCYRLFTEAAFHTNLKPQTIPEIQRSDLSQVILTMLATGIRDIVNFPFLDPPHKKHMLSAVEELYFLGIITLEGELTDVGMKAAILPVEPRLAKALVCASKHGCAEEIAILVSLMSEQGRLFFRPTKEAAQADSAHAKFTAKSGDHITQLNVFQRYLRVPREKRLGWCTRNYINPRFLEKVLKNELQILGSLKKMGFQVNHLENEHQREQIILRALLEGTFMQIAMFNQSNSQYIFLFTQREATIHVSSTLQNSNPKWITYATYMFTKADFLMTVSSIDPRWLFEIAPEYFVPENFDDSYIKRALFDIRH